MEEQSRAQGSNPWQHRLLFCFCFCFLTLITSPSSALHPYPWRCPVGSSWHLHSFPRHSHNSAVTVLHSPNLAFSLHLSWNPSLSTCSVSLLPSPSPSSAASPFWSSLPISISTFLPPFSFSSSDPSCRLLLHQNGSLTLSQNEIPIWRSPPPPWLHGRARAMELRNNGELVLVLDTARRSLHRRSRNLHEFVETHAPSRSLMEATMDVNDENGEKVAESHDAGRNKKILAMEIVFPVFAFLLLLLSLLLLAYTLRRRKRIETKQKVEGSHRQHAMDDEALFENLASKLPPRFSYGEIVAATRGFQKKLGEGAYGVVYEGSLKAAKVSSGPIAIAVKVFSDTTTMACRKGFCAEVMSIGQKTHPNLVSILGFCAEDEHRMLVYELMANGSLNKALFRRSKSSHGGEEEEAAAAGEPEFVLDWEKRIAIATDTAKALAFLHAGDESSRVVHCDVKPENILLNQKWEAKVSDFGLAKLMASSAGHHDDDGVDNGKDNGTLTPSHHNSLDGHNNNQTNGHKVEIPLVSGMKGIRGTFGYLAPEWIRPDCTLDTIAPPSDVYSFGIVLLELIAGRRSILPNLPFLPGLAFDLLAHGKDLAQIVDPSIPSVDPKEVRIVASIALWCIQEDLSLRPSMAKVLDMLTKCIPIPTPPICNYFIGSSHFFSDDRPSIPRGSTTSFPTFSTSNPSNTSTNSTLSWQVSILSGR